MAALGAEINLERHGLDKRDPWTVVTILNFIAKTNGIEMVRVEETPETVVFHARDCPMKGYLPGCNVWVYGFVEMARYLQPDMRLSYECRLSEGCDHCQYTFYKKGGLGP
jgi:hypothetical protein